MLQARMEWITSTEAAAIIGCTIEHVSLLVRKGTLKAQKFGPSWAIDRQSVLEFAKIPKTVGRPRLNAAV